MIIIKIHILRLIRGQDLKQELIRFTEDNNIQAGIILSCVGCLTRATLRLADATIIKNFEEDYEIVSLEGTLSPDGVHLHISLSDKNAQTIGGHLMENCLVGFTAEIIIGELRDYQFSRKYDSNTGYKELEFNKSDNA